MSSAAELLVHWSNDQLAPSLSMCRLFHDAFSILVQQGDTAPDFDWHRLEPCFQESSAGGVRLVRGDIFGRHFRGAPEVIVGLPVPDKMITSSKLIEKADIFWSGGLSQALATLPNGQPGGVVDLKLTDYDELRLLVCRLGSNPDIVHLERCLTTVNLPPLAALHLPLFGDQGSLDQWILAIESWTERNESNTKLQDAPYHSLRLFYIPDQEPLAERIHQHFLQAGRELPRGALVDGKLTMS